MFRNQVLQSFTSFFLTPRPLIKLEHWLKIASSTPGPMTFLGLFLFQHAFIVIYSNT